MGALKITNVTKSFGKTHVLKGIDIDIADGEFLILVGPSGCGKSTLMNIIAGLEQETSGELELDEETLSGRSPRDRDIAMVFQSYALYPTMNVARNISFGLEMRKVPKDERDRIVNDVASLLQIDHLLDRKPSQLSGGQRQRVAMGRALARSPKVFLFDEPLSNLDAKLRVEMRTEIKKLHRRLGTTIVYVTHDQIEAMTLANRIAVMKDGIIQQLGTPDEIYNDPANQFVAGFMGSPPMNFITVPVVDGKVQIESGDQRIALNLPCDDAIKQSGKDQVVLGVRPEMVTEPKPVAESNWIHTVPMSFDIIEPMGADTMATGAWNGCDVHARLSPKAGKQASEGPLDVQINTALAVAFDVDSGDRIR